MIKASEHTWTAFYRNLGYLFFAIAAADKTIREEEIEGLHREIRQRWLDLEDTRDNFGTDAAFTIESVFDLIRESNLSSEAAFRHFEGFYRENSTLFTPDVVRKIYDSAGQIAESFHGANKKELAMLFRLHTLLGRA